MLLFNYSVTGGCMALSNAEKQRRYRERALKDHEGLLLTRLQVLIKPHSAANLERLAKHTAKTKRELIEMAIDELAERLQCNYE